MLLDARQIEEGAQLDADLCIVGAGAAGMTLAKELAGTSLRVVLLESGGFEFEAPTQDLYRGKADGCFENGPDYILTSRLRFFGGTTNHWTGWTRPLEPLDFEARPWMPHSGWPFSRATLEPFYERAIRYVDVEPFGPESDRVGPQDDPIVPDDEDFHHRVFHTSPPARFGAKYRQDVVDAENVRVVLFGNAVEFALDASGRAVDTLRAATLGAKKFSIRARRFVLACGGIENARMLLLSDAVHKKGLGNELDLVGRFFAEHPSGNFGVLRRTGRANSGRLYNHHVPEGKTQRRIVGLAPSAKLQREHHLANMAVFFIPYGKAPWDEKSVDAAMESLIDETASWEPDAGPPASKEQRRFLMHFKMDQFPNPESRVTLIPEKDALGLRKVHLRWLLQEKDWESLVRFLELFGDSVGRRGLGRLRRGLPLQGPVCPLDVNKHHMGTTRMAADPRQGVTDAHGRVHGIENLFVGGSSLFPSFGFANPTLTIVALAIRLADRIKELAKEGG